MRRVLLSSLAFLFAVSAFAAPEIEVLYADPTQCAAGVQCPMVMWTQRELLSDARKLYRKDYVQIIVIYSEGRRVRSIYGNDYYFLLLRGDEYMLGGYDDGEWGWSKLPELRDRNAWPPGWPPKGAIIFKTTNGMLRHEDWLQCLDYYQHNMRR